jgi:hypothetical protein
MFRPIWPSSDVKIYIYIYIYIFNEETAAICCCSSHAEVPRMCTCVVLVRCVPSCSSLRVLFLNVLFETAVKRNENASLRVPCKHILVRFEVLSLGKI